MTLPVAALELIQNSGAKSVSVVYREVAAHPRTDTRPDTQREWSIDAETVYHAASTMKVAVMMEVYRQAHTGRLNLGDRVKLTNSFVSIADGSPFSVDAEDDADPSLHQAKTASIDELTRRMIVRSGNLATNLLIDRVGLSAIQEFMKKLGASDVHVLRGVADERAFDKGLNSTVTARGLAHILAKLARREVVSPQASDDMLDVLLAQEFKEGIPAGLPPGTPVAHKTGWNSLAYHDAAVIDPHGPTPKVLVILTTGLGDMEPAGAFVAELTKALTAA